MKPLRGRCAVVTGASRGIGVHVALALAGEGMSVALAARDEEGLQRTKAAVTAAGGQAIVVPTDVTDEADLWRLVRWAEAAFDTVDVVVNNAGVETFARYDLVKRHEIEAALRVNLLAPMLLTQLALPGMLARGRGHIVNVASLAGRFGLACMETYAATKSGVLGFTQSLRATYRGTGVSASAICPGFVAEGGMYARFQAQAGLADGAGSHGADSDGANSDGADSDRAGATGGVDSEEAHRQQKGRQFRAVPAAAVGQAVVRAITRDLPDVIVAPRPIRPLLAGATLSPRLAERVTERLGLHNLIRQVARGGLSTAVATTPAAPHLGSHPAPAGHNAF